MSIVSAVASEEIQFSDGLCLGSEHREDCCESHYLDFSGLSLADFDGLEFELSEEGAFFERVPGYGIRLKATDDRTVAVPGYGNNNGYYGTNIDLVIKRGDDVVMRFDVSECQEIFDV